MKYARRLLAIAAALSITACGDPTSLDPIDMIGVWSATVYEYTDNANASSVVDIIQRDGATFTVSIEANENVSVLFTDGMGNQSSDSGDFNVAGNVLRLSGVGYTAVRDGETLTLTHADQQFDFGSGSSVSASVRIVLGRL